jgi:hypothetical protein
MAISPSKLDCSNDSVEGAIVTVGAGYAPTLEMVDVEVMCVAKPSFLLSSSQIV